MKIEKNIEIPMQAKGVKIYPFDEMDVGDSFFAAGKTTVQVNGAVYRHKQNGKNFTCRSIVEKGVKGVRIWRTK